MNQQDFPSPSITERVFSRLGRSDFLPYRFRKRLIRAFADHRSISSRPFKIPFFGLQYSGNLNTFVDWYVFFFGAYEKYMLAFMADVARLKPGCVYVDVGANTGQHVIFMSRLAERVHAFEPWDEAIAILKGQIESNRLGNVKVHACALGSESVLATYYPPTDSNRGVGSFVEAFAEAADGDTLQYPIERGDAVVDREIGRFDLIKIDTEGFEREVIRGLGGSFERYRPVMVVELSHNTDESFGSLSELAACLPGDYVLYGIRGVHNGYRYRLCVLDDANWEQFLDIVAMPAELSDAFSERVRRYPFYSKPSDISRMLRAQFERVT